MVVDDADLEDARSFHPRALRFVEGVGLGLTKLRRIGVIRLGLDDAKAQPLDATSCDGRQSFLHPVGVQLANPRHEFGVRVL